MLTSPGLFLLTALILIAMTNWVDCPPSLSPHHPALLDTSACLSLTSDIFLKEASISDISKKIASTMDRSLSKQQKEFFSCQQLTVIQPELSALQSGVSDSTAYNPANNSAMSEFITSMIWLI